MKGMPKIASVCEEEHPEWDWHAGEWEIALVLLRRPELVDQTELEKLAPNWEGEHLSGWPDTFDRVPFETMNDSLRLILFRQ
jgi:hypothetical protein